jgi:hypothetical protein
MSPHPQHPTTPANIPLTFPTLPRELCQLILLLTYTPYLSWIRPLTYPASPEILQVQRKLFIAELNRIRGWEKKKIRCWADVLEEAFPDFIDDVEFVEKMWCQ